MKAICLDTWLHLAALSVCCGAAASRPFQQPIRHYQVSLGGVRSSPADSCMPQNSHVLCHRTGYTKSVINGCTVEIRATDDPPHGSFQFILIPFSRKSLNE